MIDVTKSTLSAMEVAGRVASRLAAGAHDASLTDYAKAARVEPIVMVDQKALHLPYMTDVMQSLVSIFSGYYLQAVAFAVPVGGVDTIRLLDRLNPSRQGGTLGSVMYGIGNDIGSARKGADASVTVEGISLLSEDSYRWKLPVPGQSMGLEAVDPKLAAKDEVKGPSVRFGDDTIRDINDAVNLSVGKMLEVHIDSNGQKASFPVSVRLIASPMPSESLLHILSIGNKMTSSTERYHAWRAGQLEFVRDLILCQDLIDEHKKTLANDKTGVYADILARRRRNNLTAMSTGSPSMATASNIAVLTDTTARELERRMNGRRLKDFSSREKVFKETYMMLMVVINPEWEQVTIYHRGLDTPTQLSVRDIKASNRGNGPDVAEILKAYQLGNSPSI